MRFIYAGLSIMAHNPSNGGGLNKAKEVATPNTTTSSILPNFFPDVNFQFEGGTGLNNQLKDLPAEMRQLIQLGNNPTSSNSNLAASQLRLPATNPLSKLPTAYAAPAVARAQRPPPSNFPTRNLTSINPADYALFKNNAALQSSLNANLGQMHGLGGGFNNYGGFPNQLGVNPSALAAQARAISGRPMMGRNDNLLYSLPPGSQNRTYLNPARTQYPGQTLAANQVPRVRAPVARPVFPSTTASNVTRPPTNEKSFALLYSQLSTTNQALLGECLTNLKNKTITWDEFQVRTKEMFGDKHSAFIQAIGAEGPRQGATSHLPQDASSAAATPLGTPSGNHSSVLTKPLTQAAAHQGPRNTGWNRPTMNPNQVSPANVLANQKAMFGANRPQPIGLQNPSATNSSVKAQAGIDTKSTGEDGRNVDYDYTDVMGSVGVDLREESENIMRGVHLNANANPTRTGSGGLESYKLPPLIDSAELLQTLQCITKTHDITEVSSEFCSYVSLAVEERLRGLIEQMIHVSKHRQLSQQSYPTPPLNDSGKPIYKVIVHSDVRKQLKAIERVEKDKARKYYLRLEEGSNHLEENETRSKKLKTKKDPTSSNSAAANAKNMSEESRKHFANQTTHMFTGKHRKSWMLASTTPRISSPLASTPPTTPKVKAKEFAKDSKQSELIVSPTPTHLKHIPSVSSNLNPKPLSGPSSPSIESKFDQSGQFRVPINPNSFNLSRNNLLKNATPTTRFSNNQSSSRSITIKDALFVMESDAIGRPCPSRAQILLRAYSNQL